MSTPNIATGALVEIAYVREDTFGVTPLDPAYILRRTSFNVNLQKEFINSEETRSDRQRIFSLGGYNSVTGNLAGELSPQSWDDFLEGVLGGNWDVGASTYVSTISFDKVNNKITSGSVNFIANNFKLGDVFRVYNEDISLNGIQNAYYTVLSITASSIRVEPDTLVTSFTASAYVSVVGRKCLLGNRTTAYSFERWFSDLDKYQLFQGIRLNRVNIKLPSANLATIEFEFMGQDGGEIVDTSSVESYQPKLEIRPFTTISGEIYENGQLIGYVTSLELDITNNLQAPKTLCRHTYVDIIFGNFVEISGTISVIFVDKEMLNRFTHGTETSLIFRLQDTISNLTPTTSFLQITLPRIKYVGGEIDTDSEATGVVIRLPFVAFRPLYTEPYKDLSAVVIQTNYPGIDSVFDLIATEEGDFLTTEDSDDIGLET